MRRRISFGRAALICALFLCVDVILVSIMLPVVSSAISSGVIPSSVIPSGVIPSGVISVGSYECTERYGAPEPYCIKIYIPAFTLTLLSGKALVKTYPIAVGKPASPSRIGTCKVVEKATYPTWYPPDGRPPVPPGPDNPISCRWLGLSWSGYGIHGTNNPGSIGKAVTLGCIRMHDRDVIELFDIVPVGTKVEFVYETLEVSSDAWEPMEMRLTVYRDLYQIGTNTVERVLEFLRTYLAQAMPGAKPDMIRDTTTISPLIPDVDRHALAALLSAARGEPEPVPWQVRVELGVMAGSLRSSRGTGHRTDFDVDAIACESTADSDCIEVVDIVCVETGLARIEGNEVLVALRPVAEAFGYRVSWDEEWQAAIVNQHVVGGVVREGRLYVTLDELRHLLDEVAITWDPQTLTLRICTILPATQSYAPESAKKELTAEKGGESRM